MMNTKSIFSIRNVFLVTSILLKFSMMASAGTVDKYLIGQFCQFDSECRSGCCTGKKCQDYNSCPILK